MIDPVSSGSQNTAQSPLRKERRFRGVPVRIIIPNLVTLLALCLGITAIRFAIEGRFDIAVYSILGAAILDGLDGRLARALRGTSRFGAELDSLADFVDFAVAPGIILYLYSLHEIKSIGWFAALLFAIAGALRLARFNVMIDDPNKPAWMGNFFTGMPAPAGAIVGLLPVYLSLTFFGPDAPREYVVLQVIYFIGVAFLMASRIPHFSGKNIGRVPRDIVIFVLFGIAAFILLAATFPMQVLIFVSLGYLATIPLAIRRFKAFEVADKVAAETAAVPPVVPAANESAANEKA